MSKKAFTLMELVIVISIIAILSVTASMSLMSWFSRSKDAKRLSDLNVIMSSLETTLNSNFEYPLPDDYIEIYSSGSNIIGYQGNVGSSSLKTLNIKSNLVDPVYGTYYTYYLSKNKDKYELMAFLENSLSGSMFSYSNNVYADSLTMDYMKMVPSVKGDKLGIVLDGLNVPVQNTLLSLDLANSSTGYKLYFANDQYVRGSGDSLTMALSAYRHDLAVNDKSLLCYYSLDDGKKTSANDYASGLYPLTFSGTNGLPEWIDGKSYKSVRFDGIDDNLYSSTGIVLGNSYAISLWIRSMVNTGTYYVIAKSDSSVMAPIAFDYSNNLFLTSDDSYSTGVTFTGWNFNRWQHFVINRDNTKFEFYVDGKLIGTKMLSSNGNVIIDNIGAVFNNSTSNIIKGIIDEVRIYNHAITSDDVKMLHDADN